MHSEPLNDRNVSELTAYYYVDIEEYPTTGWDKFKQVVKRTLRGELFVGLWVVMREMIKFDIHTVQYPKERLPIGPRYRAVHKLLRLWESGLSVVSDADCVKKSVSLIVSVWTHISMRTAVKRLRSTVSILVAVFFADIVLKCVRNWRLFMDERYENGSEQRAHFVIKDDMLTPLDFLTSGQQKEYPGFGAITPNESVTKTPLAY